MKGTLILSGLLASVVSAHMQLSKPYPIRSPLNKDDDGQKDYSYNNPLSSSGSDYPCKGYAKDDFKAVETWQPGSSQEMELEGSATHSGGSCQLALTYDQGKTFKVIQSIEGDCPINKKYKFDIPSDAPSGDALFAWTWFNKVGNREMYMNCAMVSIGGSGNREMNHPPNQRVEAKPKHHTKNNKNNKSAKSSFSGLPELFVANVDQTGKCVTIEGEAVHFPQPGPNLTGSGASGKGYKCSADAPFLSSSSSSGEKNATTTTNTTTKVAQTLTTATATADARILSTEASTNNQFGSYAHKFVCQDGDLICSPDGWSFALCANGVPIFMGSVSAGTWCRNGAITAAH
ncbi:hypothetical protein N7457_004969 [Penicillium paradoxum]|uniref:uncharacterized protein n=1 Tax=Penicillium paradoxum TaxID=176176 RepID=UPI002546DA92|nr:uncharacterized protein N7457_004969 [Penicillium paradoxum]KAJ5783195.1 hypothetical protein N7457_004969 [Penicillium paradoxum]